MEQASSIEIVYWRVEVLKLSLRRAQVMGRDNFCQSIMRWSSFDEMRDKKITELRG